MASVFSPCITRSTDFARGAQTRNAVAAATPSVAAATGLALGVAIATILFCRRNAIRRLALFGSVLRDDFGTASDVDVLVEFEPEARVGLITLAGAELELSEILGRRAEMHTVRSLHPQFRDEVLQLAEPLYDAGVTTGAVSETCQTTHANRNGAAQHMNIDESLRSQGLACARL